MFIEWFEINNELRQKGLEEMSKFTKLKEFFWTHNQFVMVFNRCACDACDFSILLRNIAIKISEFREKVFHFGLT